MFFYKHYLKKLHANKQTNKNQQKKAVNDRQERVSFSTQRKSQFTFRDAEETLAR